jgi:hypothetical protein
MNSTVQRGLWCAALMALALTPAAGQNAPTQPYAITVMPPGGPPPRLPDGKPDLSGHWLPNSAGQGVSGRYGVDPAAVRQFDPRVTPEERPSFQPWALEKIKAMTPTELELSKSSVNCMPRGVPAIWLQNPYSTMLVHKPDMLVQLYEVLNNFRVIHTDGRPLPKFPEPLFHGNSAARWEGDTLVVESTGFDERTYIMPNGWFHSDALRVVERYTRPSGRGPEGADQTVEVGAAPLDAGQRRNLRVLLHQQQGAGGAGEAARAGAARSGEEVAVRVLLVLVLLSGPMAPAAAAQNLPPPAAELSLGWVGFADDGIVNETMVGGTVRFYLTPQVSVGPEFVYIKGSARHSHLMVTGNVLWDVVPSSRGRLVVPYLVAGGGVFQTRQEFPAGTFKSNDPAFTAGGGLRFNAEDRLIVGAEARVGWELHLRVNGFIGVQF